MWKSMFFVVGLLGSSLAAQPSVDTRGLSRQWMDLGQPGGQAVSLDLEAAGVAILPSEDGHVRVRYVGDANRDLSRVRLRFNPSGHPAELRLTNTPNNDFRIEFQVPKSTSLMLRMTAGELDIKGIEGNKDIRLHAGEIRVHLGNPASYGPVSASVWAGEVNAGPFGESQEGLFRSFAYQGPGTYSLQVKVKAGEVAFLP